MGRDSQQIPWHHSYTDCGFPLVGKETGVWGPSNVDIRVLVERVPLRKKGQGEIPSDGNVYIREVMPDVELLPIPVLFSSSIRSKPLIKIYCCFHGAGLGWGWGEWRRRGDGGWCGAETEEQQLREARS